MAQPSSTPNSSSNFNSNSNSNSTLNNNLSEPFGSLLGIAPGGVPAYCSDYATADPAQLPDRHSFRHYEGDVYTGYKWQCVEFARRWLLLNYGYVFDDIAMAYDIFRLHSVKCVKTHRRLPLFAFANGSLRHPEPGAMLIWQEGGEFETTGHVAIITEVFADKVRIAEQNVEFTRWGEGRNFSRELNAHTTADGHYWIACSYEDAEILGWMLQTDDDQHALVVAAPAPELLNIDYRRLASSAKPRGHWLNPANPDEAAYLAANGESLSQDPAREQDYCVISQSAERELKRASNELHALFMHATDHVLEHPELLVHFNIPEQLWPKLRQSWDNRRNQMITGRFDFCLTSTGLKLYEYNCDSASCHMETGKIQGRWAKYQGLEEGHDAGEKLTQHLIDAWRHADTGAHVHILLDEDAEETYHARYMQQCMKSAGVESTLVAGLKALQWDAQNRICDAAGRPLQQVWKTWAWETALAQLRELEENAQAHSSRHAAGAQVRLMDVLFHPDILIYEPLWTLIPSNKAILPILWDLFEGHEYLLNSAFSVTPELAASGFVSKPIAGHSGDNITIYRDAHTPVADTKGRFGHQQHIYQALAPLPIAEGLHLQVCSFTAGGTYAGACIRADTSAIIVHHSDIVPLRVIGDQAFTRAASDGRK